jgi:hypothetical protein
VYDVLIEWFINMFFLMVLTLNFNMMFWVKFLDFCCRVFELVKACVFGLSFLTAVNK